MKFRFATFSRAFAGVLLCLGMASTASASSFSGSYSYVFVKYGLDAACNSVNDDGYRDYFSATGMNNIGGSDTASLSNCDSTSYQADGGLFSISDTAGTLNAAFTFTYFASTSTDSFLSGQYQILSDSGLYSGVFGTGTLTSDSGPGGATFQFQSTPEPATFILFACGLLLTAATRRVLRACPSVQTGA